MVFRTVIASIILVNFSYQLNLTNECDRLWENIEQDIEYHCTFDESPDYVFGLVHKELFESNAQCQAGVYDIEAFKVFEMNGFIKTWEIEYSDYALLPESELLKIRKTKMETLSKYMNVSACKEDPTMETLAIIEYEIKNADALMEDSFRNGKDEISCDFVVKAYARLNKVCEIIRHQKKHVHHLFLEN